MRIVEINGIKLEIDERTARTVDQYKVGDKVKVLVKHYSDSYKIHAGVIVGFSEFQALPTIEIMYMDGDTWSTDSFKFVYLNSASKDLEICPYNELEAILDKQNIIDKFDRQIRNKENELSEMKYKREYFITKFATAFEKQEVSDVA